MRNPHSPQPQFPPIAKRMDVISKSGTDNRVSGIGNRVSGQKNPFCRLEVVWMRDLQVLGIARYNSDFTTGCFKDARFIRHFERRVTKLFVCSDQKTSARALWRL